MPVGDMVRQKSPSEVHTYFNLTTRITILVWIGIQMAKAEF
jgi:hypothetical protein